MEKGSPVCQAVRELRHALGDSQQAFAYRMKTAIRTITRWEATRPPSGSALAQLVRVAEENNQPEIARVLSEALGAELATPGARWQPLQDEAVARSVLGGQAQLHLPELEAGLYLLSRLLKGLDNDLPARAKIQKAIPEVERLLHIVETMNPYTTNPAARKGEGAK